MTEAEKEIKEINTKLDKILHAFGLDGSRPRDEIRQKAQREARAFRDKQALKQAKPGDQGKPCR